ncbi:MAG TPA: hypothetical protein VMV20_08020 [Chitinophagaceae bacterium]|nr:hypothetical protein [Chitinophagaceae bacterium]
MNKENLQFLKNAVKFMSFDETTQAELEKKIREGTPEFQLKAVAHFNQDEVGALLYFRKSDKSDYYFFNKYDVVVLHPEEPARDKSQTFYIHGGTGITLREAYNLLEGRSVFKTLLDQEGKKYQAWMQIDFGSIDSNGNYKYRHFYSSYGFNLVEVLNQYPILNLEKEEDKDMLIISLQRGNRHPVWFLLDEREQQVFVEAAPQFKALNVFDGARRKIRFSPDPNRNGSVITPGGEIS